jgi:hypothetical protein
MLQRFMQVLGTEEENEVMSDVVRRFWTRAKPLTPSVPRPPLEGSASGRRDAQVVDLATWARMQRASRPR